ncbi:MAG: PadR family transcriptional regulator [Candidatus Omnitrophica bacterium]|nr:PadR family transcriptional regulator [Candidatus Omnitrophota bacterium]
MIENELILLGLINKGTKHGYDIKKEIKEILSWFAGINVKSVYYPLRILEKKGYIVKQSDKKGRRPVRYIYELTSKGKERFNSLLSKSFLDFTRPQFSIDQSLYFLEYMDPSIVKRRLRARIYILKKLSVHLTFMLKAIREKKSSAVTCILEHNMEMLKAEELFLNDLINRI